MLRVAQSKNISGHVSIGRCVPRRSWDTRNSISPSVFTVFPIFAISRRHCETFRGASNRAADLIVMHLHSRHEINAFHHGVGGSVAPRFPARRSPLEDWLDAAGFAPAGDHATGKTGSSFVPWSISPPEPTAGSPPAMVAKLASKFKSMSVWMKWTAPSQNTKFMPSE